MGKNPQASRGKAARAERDAQIYARALAGHTERQIAAEFGLSTGRVHAIVAEEIGRRVGPPAEAYAARRDAELQELWTRSFALVADPAKDPDTQLKAMTTALKVNESRRKLRGVDAPEAMSIQLERRNDQETEVVTLAILTALRVLRVDGERRTAALEAAAAVLRGDPEPEPLPPAPGMCTPYVADGGLYIDGPGGIRYRVVAQERIPSPEVAQLALPPGPSARKAQQRDGADEVLDALADFEDEFGPLDDDEEDGTGGTGSDDPENGGTAGTGTGGA